MDPIQDIDAQTLQPLLRRALGREHFEVQNWTVRQMGGGAGNPVSLGLYRFSAQGTDGPECLNGSLILKIIQSPANLGWHNLGEGQDGAHWNYWKREPLLYQSDLLDHLPAGLAAPRCYGVSERPSDQTWLWLEDIVGTPAEKWSVERYLQTARLLGLLNGEFASPHLPTHLWLKRNHIRQWLNTLPWRTFRWDHPVARARYPHSDHNPFRQMLEAHERFLPLLERLPKTLSHGDTYPSNFVLRTAPNGRDEIVALDWALAGIEAFGDDLGGLAYGAQIHLQPDDPRSLDKALFDSYSDGLREAGQLVDEALLRFSYTVLGALRIGLFQLYLFSLQIEQDNTRPDLDAAGQNPVAVCFEVRLAGEAWRLLESLEKDR